MFVALLALAIALGGTAYAAGLINGSQLKDRSVAAVKIKKHTLTGTEINVSKLGTVPNAAHAADAVNAITATNAGTALHADSATTSTTAQTATTATNATHATNADALGGLGPSSFVQGSAKEFGIAMSEAPNTAPQNLVAVPEIGELTMACSNSGASTLTLANGTGATMDASLTSVVTGTPATVSTSGFTIASSASTDVIQISGAPANHFVYMLGWPQGSETHSADIELSSYGEGGNCRAIVEGVVH
jgi:hypothetical protein